MPTNFATIRRDSQSRERWLFGFVRGGPVGNRIFHFWKKSLKISKVSRNFPLHSLHCSSPLWSTWPSHTIASVLHPGKIGPALYSVLLTGEASLGVVCWEDSSKKCPTSYRFEVEICFHRSLMQTSGSCSMLLATTLIAIGKWIQRSLCPWVTISVRNLFGKRDTQIWPYFTH